MMRTDAERIAVIVPAYNAERWIDETLRSVRSQTHANLEIVVVDDGSQDRTFAVASEHAARDPRVRVVRQENAGVAAARNRGIAETTAAYIAPVDADDLWSPNKLARQLERMQQGGFKTGLVYTWFASIDEQSRITRWNGGADAEGDVLDVLSVSNITGNGSSALIRREAIASAGGYDPSLRAANAQGCEDYKLYFQIAERYYFGLVRDYLTGYRMLPDNMSSDFAQMLRSRDLCTAEFVRRHPARLPLFRAGQLQLMRYMLTRSLRSHRYKDAREILAEMLRRAPRQATGQLLALVGGAVRSRLGSSPQAASVGRDRFPIGEPD